MPRAVDCFAQGLRGEAAKVGIGHVEDGVAVAERVDVAGCEVCGCGRSNRGVWTGERFPCCVSEIERRCDSEGTFWQTDAGGMHE